MYYYNITMYLFDNTMTPATESRSPGNDSLIFFELDSMTVLQMEFMDDIKQSNISWDPNFVMVSFFDILNKLGARIDNTTMRVDGILVSMIIRSGYNTAP